MIDAQADRMRGLIDDRWTKGEQRRARCSVSPEPADVAGPVGDGRHTVRIDPPEDLPWVMADRLRIVQVLNNLLATRRDTRPSRPRSTSPRRATALHLAFSLADSARGIPPARAAAVPVPEARGHP